MIIKQNFDIMENFVIGTVRIKFLETSYRISNCPPYTIVTNFPSRCSSAAIAHIPQHIPHILQLCNSFVCCPDYSTNCLAATIQLSHSYSTWQCLFVPILASPPFQSHNWCLGASPLSLFHVLNSCAPWGMLRIKCFNILKFPGEVRVGCVARSCRSFWSHAAVTPRGAVDMQLLLLPLLQLQLLLINSRSITKQEQELEQEQQQLLHRRFDIFVHGSLIEKFSSGSKANESNNLLQQEQQLHHMSAAAGGERERARQDAPFCLMSPFLHFCLYSSPGLLL